jgi:hypothetical protein
MGLLDALSTNSDPDQASPSSGGLLGLLSNPQTAGLLGMAGSLLQASGPSRLPIPLGQVLGAGVQGMAQGAQQGLQMQRELAQYGLMRELLAPPSGGVPTPSSSAPVTGSANMAGLSGLSAGLGSYAPVQTPVAQAAAAQGPLIGGYTPAEMIQRGRIMSVLGMPAGATWMELGAKYDPSLQMQVPTDVERNFAAAYGQGTPEYAQAMQDYARKQNYIAPTALRTPIYFDPATGTTKVVPADQLSAGYGGMYGAQARAQANYKPVQVWDPTANSGKGGMVFQSTTNVADAANGGSGSAAGLPSPVPGYSPFQNAIRAAESGGNAAAANPASSAQGSMQVVNGTAASPGYGVQPAQNNSPQERARVGADYAAALHSKYGNDADAAIAYHYGPQVADQWIAGGRRMDMLPSDAPGYLSSVTGYSQAYAGGGANSQGAGAPMAAQPPLGAQADATAQAQGQVATMNASYKEARQARATGQYALTMLDDMSNYAQTKSPALANKLYNVQGIFSSDAQLFDKARDNLITQVSSSTGMNTDAARAIVEGAIPSYGMNPQAIQTGLGQIKGQVQMRMLKGDYLSDAYDNANAPAYNQRENQFDQMMTPAAAAIIKMPPGAARNQAIAAAKTNPQDAEALRWGLTVGLLH